MVQPKDTRNNKLFKLRESNPGKWSFAKLGKRFDNITAATAFEIYHREKAKREVGTRLPISRTIARNYPALAKNRPISPAYNPGKIIH